MLGGLVAENVGVAADELGVDGVERVGEGEVAFFGGHLGEEDGLEDEVAELVAEVDPVAAIDGVEDLVGLFERVGLDGVEGLFAVPGAAIGRAKAGHDVEELVEFVAGAGGVVGHGWYEGSIGGHDRWPKIVPLRSQRFDDGGRVPVNYFEIRPDGAEWRAFLALPILEGAAVQGERVGELSLRHAGFPANCLYVHGPRESVDLSLDLSPLIGQNVFG